VAVARALVARGHEPHLTGAPGWLADPRLLTPGELPVHPVWEPPLSQALGAPAASAGLARAVAEDRRLLDALRPELVVFDNRRTLGLVARRRGLPAVSLVNATTLGPHLGVVPTVEQVLGLVAPASGVDPARLAAQPSWRDRAPTDPVPSSAAPLPAALREALRALDLPAPEHVHGLSLGDRTLVCDDPRLLPLRSTPAGVLPVGPILPALTVPEPPWWDALGAEPGGVLVSCGSTGDRDHRASVLAALAGSALRVVVAGEPSGPGRWGAPLVPPETASRVSLVVCHGGSGTITRALAAGRPVLAIPGHAEQALHAVALVQAGLGTALAPQLVAAHPGQVRGLIERLAAPGPLHQATRAFGAGMDLVGGAGRAADAAVALL